MNRRMLVYGFVLWLAGTLAVRFWGRFLLRPGSLAGTVVLYVLSFLAMAALSRRLCRVAGLPRQGWPSGAISLALPTLLLDALSSAFFPAIFPDITASAAGLFGGWMLCCCAGALLGATIGTSSGEATTQ